MDPMISWQPPGEAAPVTFKMGPADFDVLTRRLDAAEASGAATVTMPDWPAPIALDDARQIVAAFKPPDPVRPTGFKEAAAPFLLEPKKKAPAIGLLMAENIEASDYVEERGRLLAFAEDQPANSRHRYVPMSR